MVILYSHVIKLKWVYYKCLLHIPMFNAMFARLTFSDILIISNTKLSFADYSCLKMKKIVIFTIVVICINITEKSIPNYLTLIPYLVNLVHITLCQQNKPVYISDTVLMFQVTSQQFNIL